MKKLLLLIIMALAATVVWDDSVIGKPPPSHMDIFVQSEGCFGCHRGRGVPGTPLLKGDAITLCFQCHSGRDRRKAKTDIESEFAKISKHPVFETAGYHYTFEKLPEEDQNAKRHVSCYDCHIVHISDSEKPWRGVGGYMAPGGRFIRGAIKGGPPPGLRMREASFEYELCYLCHSDSANLDDDKNIAVSFAPSNPSFHPVEMEGKNNDVPSLISQLGRDGGQEQRRPQPHITA
jgi:predicted CXXCH cytochrome family protein